MTTGSSPSESTPMLYTAEQAAHLLQVRVSWLRKKATARAVPCTFVGKHLRFSPADLAAIVAAGAQRRPLRGHRGAPPTRLTSPTRLRQGHRRPPLPPSIMAWPKCSDNGQLSLAVTQRALTSTGRPG